MEQAVGQSDALSVLEQKIHRAAEVVTKLRHDRETALAAASESDALRKQVADLTRELQTVRGERDALRADKEAVRKRLEKLLEQIDAISAT